MGLIEDYGLDILSVLNNTFGIEGEIVIDDLRILCPNPKHDDSDPSCYVNLKQHSTHKGRVIDAGFFHCFSCHAKGDIVSLGALALNLRKSEIRKLLEPGNTDAQIAVLQSRLRGFLTPSASSQSPAEFDRIWKEREWLEKDARKLDSYEDGPQTYLLKRGFKPKTIKRWGVRYVPAAKINTKRGTAIIRASVAIPIRDLNGTVIAWCYRRTDESPGWQPKYLYTYRSPRGLVWIGIDHCHERRHIVLGEGALDAMWIDQSGIPAIAIGGSGVDIARARTLTRFDSVTLFMDRDEAGQWAAQRIGEVLWEKMPVYVARYKRRWEGTDPQQLTPEQVRYAVENAISWPTWQIRKRFAEVA